MALDEKHEVSPIVGAGFRVRFGEHAALTADYTSSDAYANVTPHMFTLGMRADF